MMAELGVACSRFKGQFLCSPAAASRPETFLHKSVGGYQLYHHPDLSAEVGSKGVLLGQALDWRHPEKTNTDILADLTSGDLAAALAHSNTLSGRWALLFLGEEHAWIGDGGGTLSIVWNERLVGSSAALLSWSDPSIKRKHRAKFDALRKEGWHSGYAFVGTDTEYEGVHALLPNHLLALASREVRRFYPTAKLPRASLQQNAPLIAGVMVGLVRAASVRSPLAIGLTAGYDSRLVAAAASKLPAAKERVLFFTVEDTHATPAGHADITGAQEIARLTGIPHVVRQSNTALSAETRTTFRESEGMVAPRFEEWADLSRAPELAGRAILSSWASEVGRNYFDWPGAVNAGVREVIACSGAGNFADLRQEAQRWFEEASSVQASYGLRVTDLIYWELRVGRWNSACFNILGQGAWWMTLYTCRELFELMIAVPPEQRGKKGSNLYTAVIKLLCPALAEQAFTPLTVREKLHYVRKVGIRHAIAKLLLKVGLLAPARRLKDRMTSV